MTVPQGRHSMHCVWVCPLQRMLAVKPLLLQAQRSHNGSTCATKQVVHASMQISRSMSRDGHFKVSTYLFLWSCITRDEHPPISEDSWCKVLIDSSALVYDSSCCVERSKVFPSIGRCESNFCLELAAANVTENQVQEVSMARQ